MSIEIELRFEVLDNSKLDEFIKTLQLESKRRVLDLYLDTPCGRLIKRCIYIRLRDNRKIDVKFNRACLEDPTLELQAYCEEHTFHFPFTDNDWVRFNQLNIELGLVGSIEEDFEVYKKSNDFIEHRIVDKMRTTYSLQDLTIVVDEVVNLGTFLEIELMAEDEYLIEKTATRMREILLGLPLKPLETGYDSLILRKQNFEQYLQGRFILEEDKHLRQAGV